jgi:hypothetical protein
VTRVIKCDRCEKYLDPTVDPWFQVTVKCADERRKYTKLEEHPLELCLSCRNKLVDFFAALVVDKL